MGWFLGGFGSHATRHFNGGDNLDKAWFHDYLTFPSLTGFTTTTAGTGSATPLGNAVELLTDNSLNNEVVISADHAWRYGGTSTTVWFEFPVFQISNTAADIYLLAVSSQITTIPNAAADRYFGFKISDGDVTAINGNATSETSTSIDTGWGSAIMNNSLRVEMDAVRVRFYQNGTLKATHTATHPSAALPYYPHLIIRTTTTAAKTLIAGRIAFAAKR